MVCQYIARLLGHQLLDVGLAYGGEGHRCENRGDWAVVYAGRLLDLLEGRIFLEEMPGDRMNVYAAFKRQGWRHRGRLHGLRESSLR